MRENTQVDRLSDEQTNDALNSSRTFLHDRLLPDLTRVQARIEQLEHDAQQYSALTAETTKKRQMEDDERILAPLGMGIHVPVHVDEKTTMLVSMGLGNVSETAWSASSSSSTPSERSSKSTESNDAGLYVELTPEQARAFGEKKVTILRKKIQLARERESLIQGHIELTSKSIEQLEALQRNPSAGFLDFLQSS